MSRRRLTAPVTALLVVLLAGSGCSLRTAGAPTGDLELHAEFDDVANLVVGHSVQTADVTIGTVTDIELVDGRRARVTMSIQDDVDLPRGTSATLAKTSLLGEQYVELRPPPASVEVAGGPGPLQSGDEIGETSVAADFETVTERAIEFLGAVGAEDVATLTATGAEALGGRGRDLDRLLRDLSTVVIDLDDQRRAIARTIDGFARLAGDLADGEDRVVTLVEDLSTASGTLARNRDRIIGALRGIRDMTLVTNEAVLADHSDELIATIQDLDPILATLAGQRPLLEDMLTSVNGFLRVIADNVAPGSTPGQAQYIWTKGVATPSGTLGEGGGPSAPAPSPAPVPVDDPATTVATTTRQALDTLLGILGDPDVRLPVRLCRQLRDLGVDLDLRLVCGPRPGPGAPAGPVVPDPGEVVDQVLSGVGP